MIRDERHGWTTPGHWCRSRTRTVADGTAARISRGLDQLRLARGSTGPYLPQAVIAAIHATAPSWEQTDWVTICTAYDRLLELTESPVVLANRALAVGFRDGPEVGLAALDRVAHDPGWRGRISSRRCAPTCCGGRGDPPKRLIWYGRRWKPMRSEPGREFLRRRIAECGG